MEKYHKNVMEKTRGGGRTSIVAAIVKPIVNPL
jgi:hypothetical protein